MVIAGVSTRSGKLDALTSLRFFAAALIVMLHGAGRGLGPGAVLNLSLGQGVSFFFVLSGFVLTYSYGEIQNAGQLKRFLVARFARVWPAHIFVSALYIAVIANISFLSLPEQNRALISAAYIFLLHAWVPFPAYFTAYNTVSWSLSTEFFFYLAYPILARNWKATWPWKLATTFLIGAVAVVLADRLAIAREEIRGGLAYINPLARLFEFAIGVLTCNLFREFRLKSPELSGRVLWTLVEAAAAFAAIASMWASKCLANSPALLDTLGKTASVWIDASGFSTFAFAVLIFVFAQQRGIISSLLCHRPMVFLGEISFCLYLVHTLFLLFRQMAPGVFIGLSESGLYAMYWLVGIMLASFVHLAIEKPLQDAIRAQFDGRSLARKGRSLIPTAAAIVLSAALVISLPSNRLPYRLDAGKQILASPLIFEGNYRLDAIQVSGSDELARRDLIFSWTALGDARMNEMVAVHVLDGSGAMVGQHDFIMDTGYRTAHVASQWNNEITLAPNEITPERSIGIVVYSAGGKMKGISSIGENKADWGNVRLLVPVPGIAASAR